MTSTEPGRLRDEDIARLHQDYDHFSEHTNPERREEWKRRRESCPVSISSVHGGFTLLTKYEDTYQALVDVETFTSTQSAAIPPQPFTMIPEDLDPPDHRKYRKLVNPPLAPQQVATYEPWIREYTVQLLDALGERDEFDAVADFARPLPQMVTLRLMGIPMDKLELVSRTTTLLATAPRGNADADAAGLELFGYLTELAAQKRADHDATDIVAMLAHEIVDGEPITDEYLLSMMALLLFGGLHTTTGAIGGALVWLADHPDDLAAVLADPTLIGRSVDEIVRFTSPSSHLGRVVTKDTEVRGCPLPAGTRVMISIGSGNHDPEKFENPDRITWGRPANHQLGYGMGPHRCVGSHLARLQLRVALEEFLKRYRAFHVADPAALHYSGGEVRSLDYIPLVIDRTEG